MLLAPTGPHTGMMFECSFDEECPLKEISGHKAGISLLQISADKGLLLSGADDGTVTLRKLSDLESFTKTINQVPEYPIATAARHRRRSTTSPTPSAAQPTVGVGLLGWGSLLGWASRVRARTHAHRL